MEFLLYFIFRPETADDQIDFKAEYVGKLYFYIIYINLNRSSKSILY